MLGQTESPELNYHEDTKLLIAVGREQMLDIIDAVLAQLSHSTAPAEAKSAATQPKPTDESRAKK